MTRSDYWYALQVQSGKEFELEEEINNMLQPIGVAYCPRYMRRKKKSRHAHGFDHVETPLFNKYLFVKFGSPYQSWGNVTSLKFVDGFIRANGIALPIRTETISKIKNECELGGFNEDAVVGAIKEGDKIEIEQSSDWPLFGGMVGTFVGLVGSHQAKVELSLFGRSTKVQVPAELLKRIL